MTLHRNAHPATWYTPCPVTFDPRTHLPRGWRGRSSSASQWLREIAQQPRCIDRLLGILAAPRTEGSAFAAWREEALRHRSRLDALLRAPGSRASGSVQSSRFGLRAGDFAGQSGSGRISTTLPRLKKVVVAAATTTLASAVLAASYGYAATTDQDWARRFHERRASAVMDAQGRLIGVAYPPSGLAGDAAAQYAHIPLTGELPRVFVDTLLAVEDKDFGRNRPCHIDWTSLAWRPLATGFSAGASGLAQQLTKQLLAQEERNWRWVPAPIGRLLAKAHQLGAACSLAGYLGRDGSDGAKAMLRSYAEHAPFMQGFGTLRGIEAASLVMWGVGPGELSPAKQALLAVAVKRPLMAMSTKDLQIPCAKVWPRSSPAFEAEVASGAPARTVWCRATHRARAALPKVLPAAELQAALAELDALERDGVDLQQEFDRVAAGRLINLSSRSAALLPTSMRRQMTQEVHEAFGQEDHLYGQPLQLQLDGVSQQRMTAAISQALRDPAVGRHLCLQLPGTATVDGAQSSTRRVASSCPRLGDAKTQEAIVFAAGVSPSGALRSMYASYTPMLDTPVQLGSTAKVAFALAAARAGFSAEMKLCPRKVLVGSHELSRASEVAATGLTDAECRDPKNLLTLRAAMAKSDNLAMLDFFTRYLGQERLGKALGELGFAVPEGQDAGYSATMGTILATPRQLLQAWTALAAEAHGQQSVHGVRVHTLGAVGGEPVHREPGLRITPLTPAARETLRALLEAPVGPGGTLSFLQSSGVTAGKSGTTQSAVRVGEVRAVHAKLAVTYSPERKEAGLFIVSAPSTGTALAPPGFKTSRLKPLYEAALSGIRDEASPRLGHPAHD